MAGKQHANGSPVFERRGLSSGEAARRSDENYKLISVLYYALQEAETCEHHVQDAERAGDHELVDFFTELRDSQIARAFQARRLILDRLERYGGADEDDED
jgi:hypothetical protein